MALSINLSNRVGLVKPSPTLAVTARANALRAAGKDVIGLGAGEPDFDTPEHIKKAAIEAIKAGKTKYTAVDGTAELKNAIINKFKTDNQLDYNPDQILVSCGGKQSFYNLCQALLNDGDEVIIPAPPASGIAMERSPTLPRITRTCSSRPGLDGSLRPITASMVSGSGAFKPCM